MMSDKRFTLVGGKSKFNEILVKVYDNFEEEVIEKQKVVDLLNEQQATICKLQDLCGESDGKNAKLRIENKKLKEENEQLKELLKNYEYQIEKGYTDLTYEEILEKESESDE